jgi:hypothetical protein
VHLEVVFSLGPSGATIDYRGDSLPLRAAAAAVAAMSVFVGFSAEGKSRLEYALTPRPRQSGCYANITGLDRSLLLVMAKKLLYTYF